MLFAAAPGHLPTRLRGHPTGPLDSAFPDPLVLVLAGGSKSLAGRVLRADGSPAVGATVWTPDTTRFGSIPIDPEKHDIAIPRTVESMASGDEWHVGDETDGSGGFELRGLLDHPYVVCAFDFHTLGYAQSAPTHPGTEVVLQLPGGGVIPRLAGTVRSIGGKPVADAGVSFGIDAEVVPSVEGRETNVERLFGRSTRTDAEGRFEVRDLPRAACWIRIEGGGIAETHDGELDREADLTALEYRLALRCRLQVVTAGEPLPDALMILDEAGESLRVRIKRGWIESASRRCKMVGGRSEILKTSERARTLVLLRGEEEVLRAPLQLVPGELTVIRP